MFQFQYGTIKGDGKDTSYIPTPSFQFQYGTIKGCPHYCSHKPTLKFQFQYGTIKGVLCLLLKTTFLCFNSSMVRLRGQLVPIMCEAVVPFQFQYGTIKGNNLVREAYKLALFQFQYGTIKGLNC